MTRVVPKLLLAFAAAFLFQSPIFAEEEGNQYVATTKIVIDPNPAQAGTTVSVPITIELAAAEKSFTSMIVVVKDTRLIGGGPIPVAIPPYAAPLPGKQGVTVTVTFTGVKDVTYQIDATMNYKDGANANTTKDATTVKYKAK